MLVIPIFMLRPRTEGQWILASLGTGLISWLVVNVGMIALLWVLAELEEEDPDY